MGDDHTTGPNHIDEAIPRTIKDIVNVSSLARKVLLKLDILSRKNKKQILMADHENLLR